MRPELEEIYLLERYLQNTLPEEEKIEAEIRLLWDREWQEKVAAQQLAYLTLREAGRQQMRQQLASIHTKLFG